MRLYEAGETVFIAITGMMGLYRAMVVGHSPSGAPLLKVTHDPSWDGYTLEDGDYIIHEP